MSTRGRVRTWSDDDGWGVFDSPETPGGCWAGFAAIAVAAGHRSLTAGQPVEFEWEHGDLDGFGYRAVRVWPAGQEPDERPPSDGEPSNAYGSTLRIEFD